ncbi:phospholipase A2 [Entamoeba marina]
MATELITLLTKIQSNDEEEAIKLLTKVNFEQKQFHSLMMNIFRSNSTKLIQHVINCYPTILTEKNIYEEIPIFYSIRHNNPNYLQLWNNNALNHKTSMNENILHYLCRSSIQNINSIIKEIHKKNSTLINDTNIYKETPLHIAASVGNYKLSELLLNLGADATKMNSFGLTPLYCAMESGNSECVKLLESSITNEESNVDVIIDISQTNKNLIEEPTKETNLEIISSQQTSVSSIHEISTEQDKKFQELRTKVQLIIQGKRNTELKTNTHYLKQNKYKILSVDGGGVKGILSAVIIGRIIQKHPTFLVNTNLFCGCSVGSILVSLMSVGYNLDVCAELLELISQYTFIDKNTSPNYPKYSNTNLVFLLQTIFGDICLRDIPRHYLVNSFQMDSSTTPRKCHSHCFTNIKKGYENEKISDLCLRSSAAPTYFEPYQQFYIDGGVFDNCAIGVTWPYVFGKKGLNLNPKDVVCFSLSAGCPDPYYIDREIIKNGGATQWVPLLDDLFSFARRSQTVQSGEIYLGERWYRLDPPLNARILLDDISQFSTLRKIAESIDLTEVDEWVKNYWEE